jgi:hypothetical protein
MSFVRRARGRRPKRPQERNCTRNTIAPKRAKFLIDKIFSSANCNMDFRISGIKAAKQARLYLGS